MFTTQKGSKPPPPPVNRPGGNRGLPQNNQLIGAAPPVYQDVSDFQYGEVVAQANIASGIINLTIPRTLKRKKIYAWINATNTSADYYAKCVINFLQANSVMGRMPLTVAASVGASSVVTSSLPTVAVVQGAAIQDSLGLYVSNPVGTQPQSLILQPLYLYGDIDGVTIDYVSQANVTSIRVFVAVISSR